MRIQVRFLLEIYSNRLLYVLTYDFGGSWIVLHDFGLSVVADLQAPSPIPQARSRVARAPRSAIPRSMLRGDRCVDGVDRAATAPAALHFASPDRPRTVTPRRIRLVSGVTVLAGRSRCAGSGAQHHMLRCTHLRLRLARTRSARRREVRRNETKVARSPAASLQHRECIRLRSQIYTVVQHRVCLLLCFLLRADLDRSHGSWRTVHE